MLSLAPVIAAIKNANPSLPNGLRWFRQVEGTGSFARLSGAGKVSLPGCWVVRNKDSSKPSGERRSIVRVEFAVAIGVMNQRVKIAGESDDVLLAYRLAVLQVLQDMDVWSNLDPSIEIASRIQRSGGQGHSTQGDLWWLDDYSVELAVTNYEPNPPDFDQIQHTPLNTTGASL